MQAAKVSKLIANVRTVSNHRYPHGYEGPEVRTTVLAEPIPFKAGDHYKVVGNPDRQTTRECISVSYPNFVHDLNVGGHILIDDGDLELVGCGKNADHLLCEYRMKLQPRAAARCQCAGCTHQPAFTDGKRPQQYPLRHRKTSTSSLTLSCATDRIFWI